MLDAEPGRVPHEGRHLMATLKDLFYQGTARPAGRADDQESHQAHSNGPGRATRPLSRSHVVPIGRAFARSIPVPHARNDEHDGRESRYQGDAAENQEQPRHRLPSLGPQGCQLRQRSHPLRGPEQKRHLDYACSPSSPHAQQTQDGQNDSDHQDVAGPQEMRREHDQAERHRQELKQDQRWPPLERLAVGGRVPCLVRAAFNCVSPPRFIGDSMEPMEKIVSGVTGVRRS